MAYQVGVFTVNENSVFPFSGTLMKYCGATKKSLNGAETPVICQIIENRDPLSGQMNPIDLAKSQANANFLINCPFKGYLHLLHFEVKDKKVYYFYSYEGEMKQLSRALQEGHCLSPLEIARIGMMLLDSYELFINAGIAHQEIE